MAVATVLFLAGAIIYRIYGKREVSFSLLAEVFGASLIIVGLYLGTMPESGMRPDFTNTLIGLTGFDMPSLYAKTLFDWAPLPLLPIMLWHAIGAAVLLIGVFYSSVARRFLSNRLALFLGFVSFPLYLLQVPAKELTADPLRHFLQSKGLPELVTLLVAAAMAAATAICVAYVFARIVETRSIRWSGMAGRFVAKARLLRSNIGNPPSPSPA